MRLHASLLGPAIVCLGTSLGCGGAPQIPDSGPSRDAALDAPDAGFVCPQDGVRGSGVHRLFVQGSEADPLDDGTWPLLHEWKPDGSDAELCDDRVYINDTNGDGVWEPGEEPKPLGPSTIVHGEHFLVGAGSFVEFSATLCDDITGRVTFYIPNFDQEGSVALHQLYVVHEGVETLIAEATDDEPGFSGYSPFVRVLDGVDPEARPGDTLLLRSTNISGAPFSVMVWRPPSDYESWILVEVP
ncbi:MAG: hypothetical protein GXP55_17055 [Deltaproteobacteria bacterium]|nr:hypothetical protein [Deltaproteobacteria bacterium]